MHIFERRQLLWLRIIKTLYSVPMKRALIADAQLAELDGVLTTAARLYKYPYHEQLMIYAQRPDATACAEYDV